MQVYIAVGIKRSVKPNQFNTSVLYIHIIFIIHISKLFILVTWYQVNTCHMYVCDCVCVCVSDNVV